MSGHSKWHSIKHQKAATDAKRGKIFTKLANEIAIAAKDGSDPDTNFRLRLVISKAKQANMPSANIERAIARGAGNLGDTKLEELSYEGYGPNGVAILVRALSDNRNRIAAEVRSIFTKYGGNLGSNGSVAYLFKQKGEIIAKPGVDKEALSLKAIEAGAEDIDDSSSELIIYTQPENLEETKKDIREENIESSQLVMLPTQTVKIDDESKAKSLIKLVEALEDNDDVVSVSSNFDIDEEILEKVSQ